MHSAAREVQPPKGCVWDVQHSAWLSSNSILCLGEIRRFAVVGAGLAGMAITWNLMAMSVPNHGIVVDVYDAVGLGAGDYTSSNCYCSRVTMPVL